MDAQFWINAWNEGRTGFHKDAVNEKLIQYFSRLKTQKGQKILVPLCGKTKDLIWLWQQGLSVHGIELYEKPVAQFFAENKLDKVEIKKAGNFIDYQLDDFVLSCGDFFQLNKKNYYDLVYDRASLVALPFELRQKYAQIVTEAIRPGGFYLLIVYQYDQSQMQGPPFSIDPQEVHQLYQDYFSIELLESTGPEGESARLAEIGSLKQNVYLLRKNKTL